MTTPVKPLFRTDRRSGMHELQASSGLISAITSAMLAVEGVTDVRVLHRDTTRSKFFVVVDNASMAKIQTVVQAMLQIEDAFDESFDYDTIASSSAELVPVTAQSAWE